MKSKTIQACITFLLVIGPLLIYAQVDRSTLFAAYIYNFARYTTWPNENNYADFQITIIGNQKEISNELVSLSKAKQVNNKPIVCNITDKLPKNIGEETRMIVLLDDTPLLLKNISKMIEDKKIVLVTERSSDSRNVMFNLFDTPDGGLSFEINRANIISHGLSVDPEIILLGGTEIDVAELYRASQKSMDTLELKMLLMKDSLEALKFSATKTIKILAEQQKNIDSQKNLIQTYNTYIDADKEEIKTQKKEVERQQELIAQQTEMLQNQKQLISEHKTEMGEQQNYIQKQFEEIKKGEQTLDSFNTEIEKQKNELITQNNIIKRQRTTIGLSIATVILSLIALASIVGSYLDKKKKNKLLTQQKEQIEKINNRLEITNRSLYDTITKLHETQSQLVSSEKMASLGVLTAGIAHEINNPVNFIYTGINSLTKDINDMLEVYSRIIQEAETLGSEELTSKIKKIRKEGELDEILDIVPQTIEDIKVGAERATDIIKGLRNFSRIDKDTRQYADIHEGIDTSLLLLRNKFKNHIKVNKEYQQLPLIECFPGKLNQAFLNILSNAIDAMEKEGTINIRTREEKNWAIVQIEDSGKGIPEENLDKIFDPFFTTKSVGKGVGLGLSITYGIIQEHNGRIDVKSKVNVGTIFTISLPLRTNSNI